MARDLDAPDHEGEMASDREDDPDDTSALKSWLDNPSGSVTWQTLMNKSRSLVVRYLPPGCVTDLYQEYMASQSLNQRGVSRAP